MGGFDTCFHLVQPGVLLLIYKREVKSILVCDINLCLIIVGIPGN